MTNTPYPPATTRSWIPQVPRPAVADAANQVPDRPEAYELQQPADGDGWYSNSYCAFMAEQMHKAGITKAQAQMLHQACVEFTRKRANAMAQTQQAEATQQGDITLEALMAALPEPLSATKQSAVERAMAYLELEASALAPAILADAGPEVMAALGRLGTQVQEQPHSATSGQGHAGLSPQDARAELDHLSADKAHVDAYFDKFHPGHQHAKRQRQRLIQIAEQTA